MSRLPHQTSRRFHSLHDVCTEECNGRVKKVVESLLSRSRSRINEEGSIKKREGLKWLVEFDMGKKAKVNTYSTHPVSINGY